ncbi:MAG: nitroreductase family protein [Proteobacteria bacterium]|nr:nitroreductase family protein [Pseudomonadota bacterium]MBU4277440.1 nitroreductase family protein [Pseudomonadota bacterium]MBU4384823.1 nitroreductase family protein [Pseudomonadota bacterium]MBU4603841.1 nitroreductase family protein [Pseudomonadota bacterium]MCG2764668.1 nitroreductase family protein [Desulfarculaceae bacterium]
MLLLEAIRERRSVRAFAAKPVSDEQVASLIQAAVWAPSPLHQQPWSFVVIRGEEAKAKVKQLCQATKQAVIDGGGPSWVGKYSFDFLDQAPVYVAVFFDPKKAGLGSFFNQSRGALAAASAAVQNLMLAATEQGLGSLWLTFFDPQKMAQALGAPEGLEVAGIIPLGVPAEKPKAPPRKAPKVFSDFYGQ